MNETRIAADRELPSFADVVVLGGGLAGLAAAAYAARGGASVLLLEKARAPGGRAATHRIDDFCFNIGPHALYAGCEAEDVLRELAVSFSGRRPPVSGGLALRGGCLHTLPSGFVSLLTTGLLSLGGKLELARVLASIEKVDPRPLRGRCVREWIDGTFRDQVVREIVEALTRVTGYANDPTRADAGAAIAQLQRGLRGVSYLDSGWQTLVDGLAESAVRAGARIESGQHVRGVHAAPGGAGYSVECDGGRRVDAGAVVMAVAPAVAAALYHGPASEELRRVAGAVRPVRAACLDLALRRLPDPRVLFCLGVDRPLYFSVHSASARLAPSGGGLVHVAKYLPGGDLPAGPERHADTDRPDPRADEGELEGFCDLLQPGWRKQVVERRYLPAMTVVHALVEAGTRRPAAKVEGADGLWLAGDWVGDQGMLLDTALASARVSGCAAAAHASARRSDSRPQAA
ncbi:MAG: FAD-dependent oxidoreductase [Deltaproteobacteria bacterium]|nr:FAD-dependent oxidoreductase [Deltaproteobacteria bacterium]